MERIQRIDTYLCDRRVIALRYRISTNQWCPWLVAMGEEALPSDRNERGRFLSKLFATN